LLKSIFSLSYRPLQSSSWESSLSTLPLSQ